MAARELPGLGLQSDWALGENGWKIGMDANLLMLSILVNSGVDGFIASLPVSPADGDLFILNAGPNINKLALFDLGVWKLYTPIGGWRVYIKSVKRTFVFDGDDWVREQSDGIVELTVTGGTVNAIQATIPNGLTVEDTRFFYVDISAANANTGPVTIAINGGSPMPVTNINDDVFVTGEWQGRMFLSNETSHLQALTDAGAAAAAAASAALAESWADLAEAVALPDNSIAETKYITDSVSRRALAPDAVGPDELDEEAVLDAHVSPTAAIKASKLAYSLDEADLAGKPLRSIYHRLREKISVKDTGARGTGGADDDYPAFQEAIEYAETKKLRAVHIPAHDPSAYYRIHYYSLQVQQPIAFIGENPICTVAQSGYGAGQYMFNVNGLAFPNLEHVTFKGFTIRPWLGSGNRGSGIRFDRCAHITMEDMILYTPASGIVITGDRSYANSFTRVSTYGASAAGLVYDNFQGGGQHNFYSCAFNAGIGFHVVGNSLISGLNFFGTAFEGCGQAVQLEGEVWNVNFKGSYFEKNGILGGSTIALSPAAGETIALPPGSGRPKRILCVNIDGCIIETDVELTPVNVGGGGYVPVVSMTNCVTEGYSPALLRLSTNQNMAFRAHNNDLHTMTQMHYASGFAPSRTSYFGNFNNFGDV